MCPICGANCRCRNAGPGGLCCSCHRHRPRRNFNLNTGEVDHAQATVPEVPNPDAVHLRPVRGVPDLLSVRGPAPDVPRQPGGRVRDSRDQAQISWLTEYGRLLNGA